MMDNVDAVPLAPFERWERCILGKDELHLFEPYLHAFYAGAAWHARRWGINELNADDPYKILQKWRSLPTRVIEFGGPNAEDNPIIMAYREFRKFHPRGYS